MSAANNAGGNFNLTNLTLYADANGDGVPDNSTALFSTGPLAAGEVFKFVAAAIVPGGQTAGQTAALTGTATGTPAAQQNNVDNVTVTSDGRHQRHQSDQHREWRGRQRPLHLHAYLYQHRQQHIRQPDAHGRRSCRHDLRRRQRTLEHHGLSGHAHGCDLPRGRDEYPAAVQVAPGQSMKRPRTKLLEKPG